MSESPTPPDGGSEQQPVSGDQPPMPPPPPNEPPGVQPPRYGAPPENAAYADWGTRAVGYIIDMIPTLVIYFVFWIIALIFGGAGSGFGVFVILIGVLATLAFTIWNRWLLSGRTGQTLGRRVTGTRLVGDATGQPLGPAMAFVRDLAHTIDSLICYIGWLFPLWDPKRQTIADKLLTSVVVPGEKQDIAAAIQWMRSQDPRQ